MTTLSFLHFAMSHADFIACKVNTRLVEKMIAEMAEVRRRSKTG